MKVLEKHTTTTTLTWRDYKMNNKNYHWNQILVVLIEIICAFASSFIVFSQAKLIDCVVLKIQGKIDSKTLFTALFLWMITFFIPILQCLSRFEIIQINHILDEKWEHKISDTIKKIPYYMYEEESINYISKLKEYNLYKEKYALIVSFCSEIVQLLVLIVIIFRISVYLVFTFFLLGPLVVWYSFKLSNKEFYRSRCFDSERRHIFYKSSILRSREYAKEIRAFNSEKFMLNDWKANQKKVDDKVLKVKLKCGFLGALLGKSEYLVMFINLLIVLVQFVKGSISIGNFVSISGEMFSFHVLYKVQKISSNFRNYMNYKKIFSEVNNYKCDLDRKEIDLKKEDCIEFKNVYFKYEKSDEFALENISFSIKRGERIALVGSNGAGKTTLIKLILGLYKPTKGLVLVNGVKAEDLSPAQRKELFSVVFQDFAKFCLSVKENVFFDNDKDSDYDLDISKNIDRLPEKENTIIGKDFGEHVDLSGGEWQKIAICRAMSKQKEVLILDEPTASLDPIAEINTYKAINEKCDNDITTIYITHRLGLTKDVDRIFVMDKKTIVETGSFNELMNAKKVYYTYYQTQKEIYSY